jgi:diadenosine tetraphosphatase ApaH/serine/threonine PP2A family protein phosphatase
MKKENERIVAIGDVHGCYEELMELLTVIGFYEGKVDKLIFVGDLIDKGPNPKEVIEWVKTWENCCAFVIGNHEEKHLRYHMHEHRVRKNPKYKNPMTVSEDFLRTRTELLKITDFDAYRFMDTWNHYYYVLDEKQHLILHGGLLPGVKAEDMHPKIITRVRYLKSDTEMAHVDEITPDMPFWTEKYKGPEKIIFGHQPFHEPHVSSHAIGIDTGCVHGNKLSAYSLWDETIVSVPARKQHYGLRPTSTGTFNEKWEEVSE